MSTMRAAVVDVPGSPEVFQYKTVKRPEPASSEVLIKVRAFGLNRAEMFARQGYMPEVKFPRILGIEGVGTIEAAPGGQFEVGQKVATVMGGMGRYYDGSYAEYVSVPAAQVVSVVTTLDWAELAALPELLQTAWGSLRSALDVQAGHSILIRGGTSAVGLMAARLAKNLGLTVLATTRDSSKSGRLRDNGADHVLIDSGSIVQEVRQIFPDGVDRVLELVGPTTLLDSLKSTAARGVVCVTGMVGNVFSLKDFAPMAAVPSTVRLTTYAGDYTDFLTTPLGWYADEVAAGRQTALLDRTFAFEELVEAHRYMESNKATGKIVVVLD